MNRLGNKIRVVLIGSIVTLTVGAMAVVAINQINALKYQKILNVMTREYSIISKSEELILAYNVVVKNSRNEEVLVKYQIIRDELTKTIEDLEVQIEQPESRILMLGVKNTVNQVLGECDIGIEEIKNNKIDNISNHYAKAHKYNEFVASNTNTLLQKELEYLSLTQAKSQRAYALTIQTSLMLYTLTVIVVVIMASRLSKQLTLPLMKLSAFAEEVALGNFQNRAKQNLTISDDEIGSLTKSVYSMVDKLMAMISQEKSNSEKIQENKRLVEKNNSELEKMNSYMVGRELKMIQLKKKIRELEVQQQKPQ